ncbi:S41 family peptidase [Dysgonomonas sp. Marseille-P4361]|uniref:S41 family peptidase n=1 Tax=Dysgonomonas sp. Marseille-P4361 TaxID=2161820 RepID=UPI000D54CADB|nr:S41 family peptidase [Dysgonomonas sp. Marseille-P4361]
MRNLICSLLTLVVLISCNVSNKDNTMSFNGAEIRKGWDSYMKSDTKTGWFTVNGNTVVDTTTLYKDNLYSLLSTPAENDPSKICQTFYNFDVINIEGDSVSFSGNFKVSAKDSLKVHFGIQQIVPNGNPITKVTEEITINGDSDWLNFDLTSHMDESVHSILFFILSKGEGKIWTSNWQGEIDGKSLNQLSVPTIKEDKEFDESSKVVLDSLTPQMLENLEALGRVWGFLKYYHPEVTKGKYNWDYELFKVLPTIGNAKDKEERSKQIGKWIDKYGEIKDKEEYIIADSSKYSRIINLDWLNDESIFNKELIEKLNTVKNAKRSKKSNYYMLLYRGMGRDYNGMEKAYKNISWEDQGYRILTLFRLWNAVEYCAPYVEMTDNPWRTLLKEYIPLFLKRENKTEYELSIVKLFSNVNESHGGIRIPNHSLSGSHFIPRYWAEPTSLKLIKSQEGKVVVSETEWEEFQRGDVILKVGDKTIDEAIKEREPYLATSNPSTLYRDLLPYIFSFDSTPTRLTIERDGNQIEKMIGKLTKAKERVGIRKPQSYTLEKYNIGYIDVSKVKAEEISKIVRENKNGIILDMRSYPDYNVMRTLVPLLTDKAYPYVWFSSNESTQVGNFKFMAEYKTEANSDYYKGKVAIVVNEGTQSHGEFSSMAYRKAPRSAIIGSQTAGADGNIQTFSLPGNISVTYTGLGTYYPNWEVCQRVGLKIDIPVRPTVKGVREGRDELLEEAIKFIMK